MSKILVVDDLIYDGKNIIIPGYWRGILYDIVKMAADENYKPDWNEADVKDFKNFMKFSERVFDIDGEYDGN